MSVKCKRKTCRAVAVCGKSRTHGDNGGDGETQFGCALCPYPLSVVDLARGADMLLCMCWDDQESMIQSGESVGQCGTIGAAEMAREAGVKKLVLVHVGSHLASHGPMEKGIGDVRKIFDGELIFAEELMSLYL